MAIKWISYIWDKTDYRGGEGLVALAMADSANDEGRCHPKIETIAKKARLSVRQVQRILKCFENDGFLEIERFKGRGREPQFQLKKVTSTTPFSDRKKVTSVTKKGDICDKKKVTSVTLPLNKEEPLIEPSENREEEAPKKQPPFTDELLATATEAILGFKLEKPVKTRLIETVPAVLRPDWPDYLANRLIGLKRKPRDFLEQKLGYILTDYKRDNKALLERIAKHESTKLPTIEERERERERQKTLPRADPKEFMQGMRKPGRNDSKTITGN